MIKYYIVKTKVEYQFFVDHIIFEPYFFFVNNLFLYNTVFCKVIQQRMDTAAALQSIKLEVSYSSSSGIASSSLKIFYHNHSWGIYFYMCKAR